MKLIKKLLSFVKYPKREINFSAPTYVTGHIFDRQTQVFGFSGVIIPPDPLLDLILW